MLLYYVFCGCLCLGHSTLPRKVNNQIFEHATLRSVLGVPLFLHSTLTRKVKTPTFEHATLRSVLGGVEMIS